MELKDFVEAGIEKAGGTGALAKLLDLHANQVTDAKSMRVKLPPSACYMLAEIIEGDALQIIAASELVTEKRPERRAVFLKYLCAKKGVDSQASVIFRTSIDRVLNLIRFAKITYQL